MKRSEASDALPRPVCDAFAELAGTLRVEVLGSGLLHLSLRVRNDAGGDYVLQRVNPIFAPGIQQNIELVTKHLLARGLRVAPLLRTKQGTLAAECGELGRWRLAPHLGGTVFDTIQSRAQARSAGAMIGRFHRALEDFDAPLAPMGIPYRDTPRYLRELEAALAQCRAHRLYDEMAPIGRQVLAAFDRLGDAPATRSRVIHGDLKFNNLLFEGEAAPARDRAFALIDFDTLMRAPLHVELGDAWRSWCNPAGEDTRETGFDFALFETSAIGFLEGYGATLPREEREALVDAPERLALELCARFATDALREDYFGWDPARFESHGAHSATRAAGQWQVYEAARACRDARAALLLR